MKTDQQSAFSDQSSAPSLNAFFEDNSDTAPARTESDYDFFGDSHFHADSPH